MDKIREVSGDWTTHLMAGFMATMSHENEIFMGIFVGLIVVIVTSHVYHLIQKLFGIQNIKLCVIRVQK